MTTLIPFDFEAAKRGEPVVTRDGKRARIVCWDMKGNYPLIVIAPNYDETEGVYAIGINGCFNARESNLDLFMAPKPIKKWRVVYRGADDNAAQRDFETREEAYTFAKADLCNTSNPFIVEVTP